MTRWVMHGMAEAAGPAGPGGWMGSQGQRGHSPQTPQGLLRGKEIRLDRNKDSRVRWTGYVVKPSLDIPCAMTLDNH